MTHSPCCDPAPMIRNTPRTWPRRLLLRLLANNALRRQHCALLKLDDHLLSDVGITRAEVANLSASHGWNAPNHWKR